MAKYKLRLRARKERSKGESVRDIARKVGVAKSTVSLWVRDIILSVEQLEKLKQKSIKGSELGRLKGSLMQKQRRLDLIESYKRLGTKEIGKLNNRELLISGTSLYWAEGSKKYAAVQFCNSDPKLIMFMIKWLNRCFGVHTDRLTARVAINEIHIKREEIVKKYWSRITGVPLSRFRKTSFKKSKVNKVYENYDKHFGTLDVIVLKQGELYYRILGLIEGLGLPA